MWYVLISALIHTLDIHGTCTTYITCRSTGFILEGFPTSPDDLRCLASKGLFTDCAVVLQVRTLAMVVHSLMYRTIKCTHKIPEVVHVKSTLSGRREGGGESLAAK